jgi:hypothetical protein
MLAGLRCCRVEILKAVVMCKAGARDVIIWQTETVTDPARSPAAAQVGRDVVRQITAHRAPVELQVPGPGRDRPPRSPVRRSLFYPEATGRLQTAERHNTPSWQAPGVSGRYPKLPESTQRSIRRRYATGEVSPADLGRSVLNPLIAKGARSMA